MNDTQALAIIPPNGGVDTYRMSTDAAGLCGEIVKATAQSIQGKRYVKVEGWQAIAVAHGCAASARGVEVVEGGIRAIGEVRRMDTGAVIAEAEGFVGDDEKTWASRPMYARRAMAQTRAISRACRSAFAHVVVMIDKDLSTTPAEEMGWGTDDDMERLATGPRNQETGQLLSTYDTAKIARAKDIADRIVQSMNLSPNKEAAKELWAAEQVVPPKKRQSPLDWLRDNAPGQFKRCQTVYENVVGLE